MPPRENDMIQYPLTLGEAGRGRAPVTLIAPPALRAGEVLVLVRTDRSYTRHRRNGRITRYGPTRVVAEGAWAHGDAGNIASGPDQLLAVSPGACWFAVGGNGVGHWSWCRPSGEIVTLSGQQRDSDPQGSLPLLRELTALAAFPADSKWREKLAEYEASFGGGLAPAPSIESFSTREERRAVAAGTVLTRMDGRGVADHQRIEVAGAMGGMGAIERPALLGTEEAILALLASLSVERRRIVLSYAAERGLCS